MKLFNWKYFISAIPDLLQYLPITLIITLVSFVFGIFFALILAAMKLHKNKFLNIIAQLYTMVIYCSPGIVLIFISYYGLPKLLSLFGVNADNWNRIIFVIIALTMICSGNLCETFRAAYLSVPQGQLEAAVCCGMTKSKGLVRIIIPQAVVVALPNMGNTIIGLLKNGALAFTIGCIDMMGEANLILGRRYNAFALSTYIPLALIYWGLVIAIERFVKYFEKKSNRHKTKTRGMEGNV